MAKRGARRYPHPYGIVFDQVATTPSDANHRFEILGTDKESGLVEVDAWFAVLSWGEHISLRVMPETPTSTRVEIEVAHKVPFDLGRRRQGIDDVFVALDRVLPGGEDVDPLSDIPAPAIGDETPDPNARWQLDGHGDHELRYWDGRRFTEHVADAGVRSTDPIPG